MSKATTDALSDLHGDLAGALSERVKKEDVSASDLNVARQFLKDNGITSDATSDPKLKSLVDDLPDDIYDSNVTPLYGG